MAADNTEEDSRKDVSRRITRLHEAAAELHVVSEEPAVYDAIIDAAVEILGFDWCAIATPTEGRFELTRVSATAPLEEGERTIRVDEGISGRTYQQGESIILDDASADDEAKPASESITSGLSIPLGERGVFQGYSSEVGAFDEDDRRVAELLALHAAAALDRIERERELKRKNEQLEEFASIVSHDLRNPLNVAGLQVDLARKTSDDSHLDGAMDALSRMETLIADLLTLAREGKHVHDFEPVALATVVERCWRTVETGEAACQVEADGTVRADPSRLRQLFENLVRNAVEHGSTNLDSQGSGDGITITVGELADESGFYVSDDGPGIPEERREQVFESGHSTAEDGTGFGLAIVRQIVDAHGWDVRVTESVDGGARFEVTDVEFV